MFDFEDPSEQINIMTDYTLVEDVDYTKYEYIFGYDKRLIGF